MIPKGKLDNNKISFSFPVIIHLEKTGSYVEASYKKIPKASNFPDYKKED